MKERKVSECKSMFVAYLSGGKLHSKASQTLNSNCGLKEQNYKLLKSDKITFERW